MAVRRLKVGDYVSTPDGWIGVVTVASDADHDHGWDTVLPIEGIPSRGPSNHRSRGLAWLGAGWKAGEECRYSPPTPGAHSGKRATIARTPKISPDRDVVTTIALSVSEVIFDVPLRHLLPIEVESEPGRFGRSDAGYKLHRLQARGLVDSDGLRNGKLPIPGVRRIMHVGHANPIIVDDVPAPEMIDMRGEPLTLEALDRAIDGLAKNPNYGTPSIHFGVTIPKVT